MKNFYQLIKTNSKIKETLFVSLALIIILLIFSNEVVFFGKYYLGTDLLTTVPPWKDYPPNEFGNFNRLLEDQTFNADTYASYLESNFKKGKFPLWNPHSYAGTPYDNDGTSLYYPITHLLTVLPYSLAVNVMPILKLFFVGIGTYFFLRELKCNKLASLASAISFMFAYRNFC